MIRSRRHLSLLVLLLLAFALRIFRLDAQSLWWDEGISLHLATSSLKDLLADRAANIHPPLYFILLKGWVNLVGVTPFAARYLSALASWLQVTAVFVLCRRWFNRRVAWLAALLVALSALSIIYAQEVRVYALLPLFYLALLLITDSLLRRPVADKRLWLALGFSEWLGFHFHYIVAFGIAYVGLWVVFGLYQQGRWQDLRHWFMVQAVVALASVPWLLVVWANRTAVAAEANAGTYLSEPTPIPFLLSQVWVFHLTGLPGSLSRPIVQLLAILIATCLLLLILLRSFAPHLLRNLLPWLLPVVAAFLAWSVRSFAHPRYVTIFAIMLLPLMAWLIGGRQTANDKRPFILNLQSLISISLFAGFLAISLFALNLYYFDPDVAKDDMRAVAHYLAAEAGPNDLILVPDTDWSLPFEYHGETAVAMPYTNQRDEMWTHLQQLTAHVPRVFAVNYRRGAVDWQNVVPFALEQAGSLTKQVKFGNLYVNIYQLDEAVTAPEWILQSARFGPLRLTAVSPQENTPADTALTVALRWQLAEPTSDRLQVALRLRDIDGWVLAGEDDILVDEIGRPTEQWPLTTPITTYHVLPLPPGTPPLTYTLSASIFFESEAGQQTLDVLDEQGAPQGQTWQYNGVSLTPALGLDNPYDLAAPVTPLAEPLSIAEGLHLTALQLGQTELGAGQPLFVSLQWRADQALPDLRPSLQLVQGEQILAVADAAPALGRYPTSQWPVPALVVEHRQLDVPATAVGPAQLIISLNDQQWPLGEVNIIAEAHRFEPPPITQPLNVQFGDVARLVGYDLPQTSVVSTEPVPLTLYWQSLLTGGPVDYVVFTHILAEDGRLIGQHDSAPDNGRRPFPTWVNDEYIIDPHELTFREAYSGNGRIEVGLYDPATGTRLQTAAGEDVFYLPVTLEIK